MGDQSLSAGTWTLKGAGKDISTNFDQFHFVWKTLTANGSVKARVVSQTNTNASAKAGVMLRQSKSGDSAYYAAFVTPGNGIVVQYRPTQGLGTQVVTETGSTVPTYLKIARSGSTYCTYTSSDGVNWTYIIGTCLTLNLSSPTLAGLVVTSHNTGTLSIATFDKVTISTTAPTPPTICPSGWSCSDIGYPVPAGSQYQGGGTWNILAGGSDIWGTSDQFRYVAQTLSADGSVSAHITAQTNTSSWAKAGVMLRQNANAGSAYYAALVTPGNGIVVQYRATPGGNAQQSAQITTGTVPTYLMVARAGNTYSAFTSSDGATWTLVPGSNVSISTSGPVLAGMAVTSHNSSALSTVTFDTVSVIKCPGGWTCADIGSPALAGSQSLNGGTWTIQGAGGDIWGTSDQFRYIAQTLSADGSVSAHITAQTNTSSWAKAGVMLRQTSDPASAYYAVFVTPGNGIVVQYRTAKGGNAQQSAALPGTTPVYLAVSRTSNNYTAYTSTDGNTWTPVAGSSVTLSTSGTVLAGMAVTSHNIGVLGAATFDTVSVSTTIP